MPQISSNWWQTPFFFFAPVWSDPSSNSRDVTKWDFCFTSATSCALNLYDIIPQAWVVSGDVVQWCRIQYYHKSFFDVETELSFLSRINQWQLQCMYSEFKCGKQPHIALSLISNTRMRIKKHQKQIEPTNARFDYAISSDEFGEALWLASFRDGSVLCFKAFF